MWVLKGKTVLTAAAMRAAAAGVQTQCSSRSRGWRVARRACGKDGALWSGWCEEMRSIVNDVQGAAAAVTIDLNDCGGVPRPDGLGIP